MPAVLSKHKAASFRARNELVRRANANSMAICCFFRWIKEMLAPSRIDDSIVSEAADWISAFLNGAFSHAANIKRHDR